MRRILGIEIKVNKGRENWYGEKFTPMPPSIYGQGLHYYGNIWIFYSIPICYITRLVQAITKGKS